MPESYYFDHDYNARNDDKILEMRSAYKAEGYGVFWMIVETMAENENGGVKASLIGGLSLGYGVAKDWLLDFFNYCISIELFYEKDGFIFSKRMLGHKKLMNSYTEFGKQGAAKRWGGYRGSNSPSNAKREKKGDKKKKGEESSAPENLCYDIEDYLLKNKMHFDVVCQNSTRDEDFVKNVLKKYHLSVVEKDGYPKKPLQLIAGLQKWILNEKNFSKNGQHNASTIGKTIEFDKP